mgnify:CR=1 FL=1
MLPYGNTFSFVVKLWKNKMCYHEVTHKYDIILFGFYAILTIFKYALVSDEGVIVALFVASI